MQLGYFMIKAILEVKIEIEFCKHMSESLPWGSHAAAILGSSHQKNI
jgi:hypothetical protein